MTTETVAPITEPEAERPAKKTRSGNWLKTLLLQSSALVLFLGAWEVLTASGVVASYLLPRASEVLIVLGEYIVSTVTGGVMAEHFLVTLAEVLLGFTFSVILGVAVGALLAESELLRRAVYPYVVGANATPRIAFAPLFVIWFGFGYTPKVLMAVAIATFPVLVNTLAGLSATDRDELRLMRSLGATRSQLLWKVRVPTALPYMFAGFETAMLFSAVGVVIGEFMSGNRGLGYVTLLSQELFRLDDAFAAIILLSIQGFVLHRLVVIAGRRLVFWKQTEATPKT